MRKLLEVVLEKYLDKTDENTHRQTGKGYFIELSPQWSDK